MNTNDFKRTLEDTGASAVHVEAGAAAVSALLKATAEPFANLPLEAEPSNFQAEQRRSAP